VTSSRDMEGLYSSHWPFVLCLSATVALVAFAFRLRSTPFSQWVLTGGRRQRKALLVGPCGSGKTALFTRVGRVLVGFSRLSRTAPVWVFQPCPHLAAREPRADPRRDQSEGLTCLHLPLRYSSQRQTLLVDIPGHPRLRARLLAQHLAEATACVLLIDAITGLTAKCVKEAADHLQILLALTSLLPARDSPKLLICLTKTDALPTTSTAATPLERAKAALGREMEKRRLMTRTTAAQPQTLEGLGSGVAKGGLSSDKTEIMQIDVFGDQAWDWDEVRLSWCTGTAATAEGPDSVLAWLDKNA
jgi:signal recognition particle receptor subunit beta